ncbi:MAG: O-acetylhomoserine aminocarboxypropyltransferase/cysteine synthase family protein [Bacteroidales bacterium]
MSKKTLHFDSLQVHAGYQPDATGATAPPLYMNNAYQFDSPQHASNLFALQEFGNIYTRLQNPTTDVFEQRMAALEKGTAALATSSGQAAQFLAIHNLAQAGDNIVSTSFLYGGTYNQFKNSFKRLGIETRFAQGDDAHSINALIDANTKAIYLENIGNPEFNIPDYEHIAEIAQKHKLALIVDNTFGQGGYIFNPITWGANIVTHSATKWIGGHGTTMGGVIIDGGNFDWGNGKYPMFSEASESYHGLNFWNTFGANSPFNNIAFAVRARVEGMRDLGACASPFNSFMLLQGLETLSLRAQRTNSNALQMAEWLEKHPKVERVNYPGLKSSKYHSLAKKYLHNGFGGVLSVFVKGGVEQTEKALSRFSLLRHVTNVGDTKSIITYPYTTTHAQLSDSEKTQGGVHANMLRFSVGIEYIDDLKDDWEEALKGI